MHGDPELACDSQDLARPKIGGKAALAEDLGGQKEFFGKGIAEAFFSFILKFGGRQSIAAVAYEVGVLDSPFLCGSHEDDVGKFMAQREAASNERGSRREENTIISFEALDVAVQAFQIDFLDAYAKVGSQQKRIVWGSGREQVAVKRVRPVLDVIQVHEIMRIRHCWPRVTFGW